MGETAFEFELYVLDFLRGLEPPFGGSYVVSFRPEVWNARLVVENVTPKVGFDCSYDGPLLKVRCYAWTSQFFDLVGTGRFDLGDPDLFERLDGFVEGRMVRLW